MKKRHATHHKHVKRIKKVHFKYKLLFSFSLVLMFLVIGLSLYNLVDALNSDNNQLQLLDNQRAADLIAQNLGTINQPLAEDPMTGNLYVPEARIVLPQMNPNLGQVLYSYDRSEPTTLHIVSAVDIQQSVIAMDDDASLPVPNVFSAVPTVQACVNGINVSFQPLKGRTPAYHKLLADQRIAYFYPQRHCPNALLLSYAEQLNSFTMP